MPESDHKTYRPFTGLGDLFAKAPDQKKTAIIFDGERYSYETMAANTRRIAAALRHDGVGRGDVIGFLGKLCPEYFSLMGGCASVNATLAPMNWRLAPVEVERLLHRTNIKTVFVTAGFQDVARNIAKNTPVENIISINDAPNSACSFGDWLKRGTSQSGDPDPALDTDVPLLLYTSGSTGPQKAVKWSNHVLSSIFQNLERMKHPDLGLAPSDIELVCMPPFHAMGSASMISVAYFGATALLEQDFDIDNVLSAAKRHGVTRVTLVPTAITMLLDHPARRDGDLSSIKTILYGGSAISAALIDRLKEELGCKLIQAYGMTESGGAVTMLLPEEHLDPNNPRLQSVGRALPGVEIMICDDSGGAVETMTDGEICIRASTVMPGYYNNEDATAAALRRGWLHSGDMGYLDEDGYLYLRGRVKEMIISGGENISPLEIEDALTTYPGVKEAAVIGVPDDKWGEAVAAVLVLDDVNAVRQAELTKALSKQIARFKIPKRFSLTASLPLNATGKIDKVQLKRCFDSLNELPN